MTDGLRFRLKRHPEAAAVPELFGLAAASLSTG